MSAPIYMASGSTYADLISLTAADRRFLVKVANGRGKAVAYRNEWRNDAKLLRFGLIEAVIVKHVGCSLGARKLSRSGLRILEICVDALDRPGNILVSRRGGTS